MIFSLISSLKLSEYICEVREFENKNCSRVLMGMLVRNAFTDICRLYDGYGFKDYRKYTFRGRKTKPIFQRHD